MTTNLSDHYPITITCDSSFVQRNVPNKPNIVRQRPFNLKGGGGGGGVWLLKKYSDFGGGKQIIRFRVFVI